MKSMFQMGFQRAPFLPLRPGSVPLLGQVDDESITCGGPDNPCPPGRPNYTPFGAAQTVQPTYSPAGAAQTVQPQQPPSSSTNIFSDIEKAAAAILAPGKTQPPALRPGSLLPAPAPANSTGVLVGVAVLGAVIAGVLFLT